MTDPEVQATIYQRRLFELFSEFFQRATGSDVQEFATFENFGEVVRSRAKDLAARIKDAYRWADEELRQFYAHESVNAFKTAREIGGLKLVQGGSSRFHRSQFDSVRGSLLYADTVLVPDPVLPWLESARQEERFRHVLFLQAVFSILHLKPLVDAELPYPAVLVFPTWEKILEENDKQTQKGVAQLVADMMAHFVDPGVQTLEDVSALIKSDPNRFLEEVEHHKLFVAPGGPLDEPLPKALERYERDLEVWRAHDWLEQYRKLPIPVRIMNGIMERVNPQYHLLENSEELGSHPLLSIEQQAHYFRLISATNSARLTRLGVLDRQRKSLIDGFGNERLRWLCQVPIEALVELRKNNENAAFRKRMEAMVRTMHDSAIEDSDRVAAEVSRELSSAIADHEREIREVQDRYSRIHGQTAVGAWVALGAVLIPSLAPFLGITAPLAVATKYAWNKIEERTEKKVLSKSLMGVLACAKLGNQ